MTNYYNVGSQFINSIFEGMQMIHCASLHICKLQVNTIVIFDLIHIGLVLIPVTSINFLNHTTYIYVYTHIANMAHTYKFIQVPVHTHHGDQFIDKT